MSVTICLHHYNIYIVDVGCELTIHQMLQMHVIQIKHIKRVGMEVLIKIIITVTLVMYEDMSLQL